MQLVDLEQNLITLSREDLHLNSSCSRSFLNMIILSLINLFRHRKLINVAKIRN